MMHMYLSALCRCMLYARYVCKHYPQQQKCTLTDLHVLAAASAPRGETNLGTGWLSHCTNGNTQQKWSLIRKGIGVCAQYGPRQGVIPDLATRCSMGLQPPKRLLQPSQWLSALAVDKISVSRATPTTYIHTMSHWPCISVYEEEVRRALESLQDALDGTHQQLNTRCDNPLPFDNEALNWDDVDNQEVEESDAELDNNDVDITGELQELPNQPDEGPQAERRASPACDAGNPQDQPAILDGTHPIVDGDWHVEEYPLASAGAPLASPNSFTTEDEKGQRNASANGLYAPFQSRMDWEFGRWAKYECISSNALTRLLSIDGISYLIHHIENIMITKDNLVT